MTAIQYRAALKKLGLSQRGFSRLLAVSERTARSWALDQARIPESAAILLRLMLDGKISVTDIDNASRP